MARAHRVRPNLYRVLFLGAVLDSVSIVFDDLGIELVLSYRRWSRVRRIRSALRNIRRKHPQIRFSSKRIDQIIQVDFVDELDLFQFMLVWPSGLPKWRRESH